MQHLNTQLREQVINFQKNQLIQTALNDEFPLPIMSADQIASLPGSERSAPITNIKTEVHTKFNTGVTPIYSEKGGGIVSLNNSLNDTNALSESRGVTTCPDE